MELLNLKLKKGQVEISSVGLVASEAFILEGERWNGWALPFFTKEEAIKVLEKVKTLRPFDFWYKVEGNKILILDTTQNSVWEEVEQTTHEGKTLYGVGAWSWTWDECEEEEEE